MSETEPFSPVFQTFRDPDGAVIMHDDRVLRLLGDKGRDSLSRLLENRTINFAMSEGRLPKTRLLADQEAAPLIGEADGTWSAIAEHERLPFVSYPHEWPAEMLYAAAEATLDLARQLHKEGLGLKDATPYNIVFRGTAPVFVDMLSIERREPNNPIWLAESQFQRAFLLPLLCWKLFGIPTTRAFMTSRDGMTPDEVHQLARGLSRLSPSVLQLASLPVWLSGWAERSMGSGRPIGRQLRNPEMASYVLARSNARMYRHLKRLSPGSRISHWRYYEESHSYGNEEVLAKDKFVKEVLDNLGKVRVLDIGCNTGRYSLAAAEAGNMVVAIDSDPVTAGLAWRRARDAGADVSVITADLAAPTPSLGWTNREWLALLPRLQGRFEFTMALAVVHHLIVSGGIPLPSILKQFAKFTTRYLLIEYIDPTDDNFRRLSRGRDNLYSGLTLENFETEARSLFTIEKQMEVIPGKRTLYLLRNREV
ncbi:MAG: class I SAM-dependent methyltransferase [Pseudomonadota bacterium]|nr:class I SAM-dependent methyltransferase [Pseudomonadota bacterium]